MDFFCRSARIRGRAICRLVFLALIFPTLQARGLALSNEQDDTDSLLCARQIAPVMVRGDRWEQDVRLAPHAITTVLPVRREMPGADLRSLSGLVPNVYLQPSGLRISSPIYVRGVGSVMGAAPVGLYVDGVPYFDRDAFQLPLVDIWRVEMLRGPQTALYGRNSIIGQMNVYTPAPRRRRALRAEVSYGAFRTLGAMLGGDLPVGCVGNRVVLTALRSSGYYRNRHDGRWNTPRSLYYGRYRGRCRLSDSARLEFGLSGGLTDDAGYGYAPVDSLMACPYWVNYDAPCDYVRWHARGHVSYRGQFPDWGLEATASVAYRDDRQRMDADYTNLSVFSHRRFIGQYTGTLEVLAQSRPQAPLRWLAGLFLSYQHHGMRLYAPFGPDKALLLGVAASMVDSMHYRSSVQTAGGSVFGQVSWIAPRTQLQLTGSVRLEYEYSHLDYAQELFSPILGHGPWGTQRAPAHFVALLPRVSLLRLWAGRWTTYITVARGFKPGGFNAVDNRPMEHNPQLGYGRESLWSYELGVRLVDLMRMLRGSLAVNFIDWRDQQIFLIEMMGPAIRNAGDVHSYSVEADCSWQPLSWLTVDVSAGYTNARYVRHARPEVVGKYTVMAPAFTGSLRVGAQQTFGPRSSWHLSGSVAYQAYGRQYFDEQNTLMQPYHGELQAELRVAYRGLYLRAWGSNLLNSRYFAYMFTSPVGKKRRGYRYFGQLGAPLSWNLAVGLEI